MTTIDGTTYVQYVSAGMSEIGISPPELRDFAEFLGIEGSARGLRIPQFCPCYSAKWQFSLIPAGVSKDTTLKWKIDSHELSRKGGRK